MECRLPPPSHHYLSTMTAHQKFIITKWIGMLKREVWRLREGDPTQRVCGLCYQSFQQDDQPSSAASTTATASSALPASAGIPQHHSEPERCCSTHLPVPGPSRIASPSHPNIMNIQITFPDNQAGKSGVVRMAGHTALTAEASGSSSARKAGCKIVSPCRHNASVTSANRPSIDSTDREDSSMSDSSTRTWCKDDEEPVTWCHQARDSRSAPVDIDTLMTATCPVSTTASVRTHIIYPDSDVEMYVQMAPNPVHNDNDSSEDEVIVRSTQSSGNESILASRGRSKKAGPRTEKCSHPTSDITQKILSGTKRIKKV